VTSDVGFLFSAAAVSMSLASLAGLVIAFRRTGVWAAYDLFRLRQIVEWGFANVVLALVTFPLAGIAGSETAALRLVGAITLVYVVLNVLALLRRRRAIIAVQITPLILGIDITLVMLATATMILGTITAFELALLALIARPMIAFVIVLATLGKEGAAS
jgi:hypothetical protein